MTSQRMASFFVGVDPGGTTGVAFLNEHSFPSNSFPSNPRPPTMELSPMDAVAQVEQMMREHGGWRFAVACESFIPRPGIRTWQPDAIEVAGALRYVCTKFGAGFSLQSPADAKRFGTNEKLKKLEWWTPTAGGHANDAQRHLLLLLARQAPDLLKGLIEWRT